MQSRYTVWVGACLAQGMLAFLLAGFAFCLVAGPVQAKTFPVDSFDDAVDAVPGDGNCVSATLPGGPCTLRAAIQESNASTSTADIITLPPGVYTLSITGANEDKAATGDLDITSNIVISGSGAKTTIIQGKQNWDDRIFHILGTGAAIISGVTISGGNTIDDAGAGILLESDDPDDNIDGGILKLSECRVTHNHATSFGGGISSSGVLTISQCTLDDNRLEGDATARGGGLFTNAGATLSMSNSTVSSNTAQSRGGGVDISNDGRPSTLNNVTIANNRLLDLDADGPEGAGLYVGNTLVNVYNSILAGNKTGSGTGDDCAGGIRLVQFTLIGVKPQGCNFIDATSTGNAVGGVPGLGPLADNGGQTPTHALLDASQALNAGNPAAKDPAADPAACYPDDQRGRPRIGRCDMGAFERPASFLIYLPAVGG